MKTSLVAASLLAVSFVASASADDALKGDLAKLQGTWSADVGPDKDVPIRLTFKGKAVTLAITLDSKDFEVTGEIALDETVKPYKTIDFKKFANIGNEEVGENKNIYTFEDDDTLKMCSGGPGNDRPTEFKAGEGGPPYLIVLSREPEKEKAKEKTKSDASCGAADDAAPKGDLAKFQGKWTTKVGPNQDIALAVKIAGKDVSFSGSRDGQDFEVKGELKLDDAAKPHKTVDWVKFVGPQGNEAPPNLGIYVIEDADTIKICNGGPGNDRPAEFKPAEQGFPHVIILKRDKAE